jgi:hypothetical protein
MPDARERRRHPRTLLEQLVWQREKTYDEQVAEFDAVARRMSESASMGTRHLQRLAAGEKEADRATPSTRRVMREMYGHSLDDLLGPPGWQLPATVEPEHHDGDPHDLTAGAARISLEFAGWAEADHVAPSFVEHVSYELARIAVDYVSTPPLPLVRDLIELRDTAFTLLRDRPNPRQSRELFFMAGTTCLLLAHASQNLGDSGSAMAQARTAWACAEQADNNGLRAWVRGTQALIAEGSHRHQEAVKFAQAGQQHAVTTDARVRLAAIEARALGRLGNAAAAVAAIDRAHAARELPDGGDELSVLGGLLTFPIAKQLFYAGGTHALIDNHGDAERMALDAITMYETGPIEQRSYGDEALARVDLATVRLARGDVDGANDALSHVFVLPPAMRIRQLCDNLMRIRASLQLPHCKGAHGARHLVAEIEHFSTRSPSGSALLSGR